VGPTPQVAQRRGFLDALEPGELATITAALERVAVRLR
jgi:hypothetical protein